MGRIVRWATLGAAVLLTLAVCAAIGFRKGRDYERKVGCVLSVPCTTESVDRSLIYLALLDRGDYPTLRGWLNVHIRNEVAMTCVQFGETTGKAEEDARRVLKRAADYWRDHSPTFPAAWNDKPGFAKSVDAYLTTARGYPAD